MQAKSASNIKVIDVSHWQGKIDWPAVAGDGVKGAFIKATDGTGGVDSCFKTNATQAVKAGLLVGFYHYAHPEKNSPLTEAAFFAKTVQGFEAQLPYVLDVEGEASKIGGAKLTAWAVAWLQEVQRLTGRAVMVYTGASFARSYLGKALSGYPLWVAHYGVDKPMDNTTWERWSVFQYTSTGRVAGISGNVDINAAESAFFNQFTKPKEENEPMTKAEQQAFEALQKKVQEQADHIAKLESQRDMEAPDWAKEAAAHYAPFMATKTGSYDFWRALTIQYRMEKGLRV